MEQAVDQLAFDAERYLPAGCVYNSTRRTFRPSWSNSKAVTTFVAKKWKQLRGQDQVRVLWPIAYDWNTRDLVASVTTAPETTSPRVIMVPIEWPGIGWDLAVYDNLSDDNQPHIDYYCLNEKVDHGALRVFAESKLAKIFKKELEYSWGMGFFCWDIRKPVIDLMNELIEKHL